MGSRDRQDSLNEVVTVFIEGIADQDVDAEKGSENSISCRTGPHRLLPFRPFMDSRRCDKSLALVEGLAQLLERQMGLLIGLGTK